MNKIDKEKLIQLKVEGATDAECAKVFGCSQAAVSEARRRLEAEGRLIYDVKSRSWTRPGVEVDVEPMQEENAVAEDKPAPTVCKTVAEYLAEEEAEEAQNAAETEVSASIDEAIDEICYEPVEVPAKPDTKKPPLGVMPRGLFYEMRRDDLRRAICEYACEGMLIDPEWVDEYNELVERYKR